LAAQTGTAAPPSYVEVDLKSSNRNLYRTFFPLLIVIAMQGLLTLAVNLADNMMLGAYSETAMSGAALVNQLHFILQSLISGVGAGVVALCSQYWGKQDIQPIKRIISIGVKFALLGGVIFWVGTLAFPERALRIFTRDDAIIAEGVQYLRVMCWTYIVFSLSSVLVFSLQSVQTVFIGSLMSGVTLVINICLNYILIFGHFGAPRLGSVGAAIATLTSRVVELAVIVIYILFVDKKLRLTLADIFSFDFGFLRDFVRVSIPVVLSGAQWGVAQAAQTAILGHISATAVAANAIASVIFEIFTVFGYSCSNAAAVTIGKTVGEGDLGLIRGYSRALQRVFILVGLFTGAMLFIFKGALVSFYTVSAETRALTIQFLIVLSVSTVGTCYEYPVESGIIAGGGDTKYAAIVDTLFMWVFTIPSAALSAFVFKFPPVATFCFLKSDQALKCIPNAIRCNRYKWVRVLTRERSEREIESASQL
jgi:putative MATE family efflux protein